MSDKVLVTNLVGEFVVFLGDKQGVIRAVALSAAWYFLIEEIPTGEIHEVTRMDVNRVLSPRRSARVDP